MSNKLPIGVQVYGLRDLLENTPDNFKNVMQQIKDMGYDGVELAGLYGLTPEYVKERKKGREKLENSFKNKGDFLVFLVYW